MIAGPEGSPSSDRQRDEGQAASPAPSLTHRRQVPSCPICWLRYSPRTDLDRRAESGRSGAKEYIGEAARRLNISEDSSPFIDDQPFERAELESVHANVRVLGHCCCARLGPRRLLTSQG